MHVTGMPCGRCGQPSCDTLRLHVIWHTTMGSCPGLTTMQAFQATPVLGYITPAKSYSAAAAAPSSGHSMWQPLRMPP